MLNVVDAPIKISIVMPSYNQAAFVEAALESIISQDYKEWEILFVDAGSNDGTLEIAERYRKHISYFVSEPDNGQSDAIHKGFFNATGDVLTWLNTDDLLLPGALQQVAQAFASRPTCNWVLGNVIWIDAEDTVLKCWKGGRYTPGATKFGIFASGGPSAFFRRELYERVGGINLTLDYQMDTELWWRFIMSGERYFRLKGYTWALRLHEAAKVSGHMFAAPGDQKQRAIQLCKLQEQQHIANLTSSYKIRLSETAIFFASVIMKGLSPSFLRGKLDHFKYKKKKINSIFLDKF